MKSHCSLDLRHRGVVHAQLRLGGGRQGVALVVEHRAVHAAQPPRQLRADLAHAQDAHRGAAERGQAAPARPVVGEGVLVALARLAPVGRRPSHLDQIGQPPGQRQHQHQGVLGHVVAVVDRPVADRDARLFRRDQVNVVRLRAEPLDQPQPLARPDHLGIHCAAALADHKLDSGQQSQDLIPRRQVAHHDLEIRGSCRYRRLLMPGRPLGDKECSILSQSLLLLVRDTCALAQASRHLDALTQHGFFVDAHRPTVLHQRLAIDQDHAHVGFARAVDEGADRIG